MASSPVHRSRMSPLLAGVWAGAGPLLLWAAHFAFCYVAVAVGCTAMLHAGGLPLTPGALRWWLVGASGVALAIGGAMLWTACRALRQRHDDLLPTVRVLAAVMALAGMVWTTWPLAVLSVCAAG